MNTASTKNICMLDGCNKPARKKFCSRKHNDRYKYLMRERKPENKSKWDILISGRLV